MYHLESIEEYTIKKPKYTYEQYQQMAEYIISHGDYGTDYICDFLEKIKNDSPKVGRYYDEQGNFAFNDIRSKSIGAKSVITRVFREIIAKNDDFDVFEKITGERWLGYNTNIWLSQRLGKICEKENDFYSIDACYLFAKFEKETDKRIRENLKTIRYDAICSCYNRLQKNKKYQGIRKDFLEIKRIIWRRNFSELIVTVGLREDILKLKDQMTKAINSEMEEFR